MWCERPPGERKGKKGNRPETSCTHLHCIQAVQAKVVNKVSRCCDLLGVHLLKVFQHAKHTLGHLLAVQEGLRWKPEAVGMFKGWSRGERQGRRGWSQRRERKGGADADDGRQQGRVWCGVSGGWRHGEGCMCRQTGSSWHSPGRWGHQWRRWQRHEGEYGRRLHNYGTRPGGSNGEGRGQAWQGEV